MRRILSSKEFGRRVRSLREVLEMSQQELADTIAKKHGVSFTQSYLSKIEKGRLLIPSGSVVFALAVELNTTTDYLLGRVDSPVVAAETEPESATVSFSEEGEEAAKIIDALTLDMRINALNIVKTLYEVEASRRTRNAQHWRQLLATVEQIAGVAMRDQVEQALLASSLEVTPNSVAK